MSSRAAQSCWSHFRFPPASIFRTGSSTIAPIDDATERVVAVEFTDGTQESIADNVNASMLKAGFKLGKRYVTNNGHIRMTYRMKRYGNASVVVEAGSGQEAGRVVYRWMPSRESR